MIKNNIEAIRDAAWVFNIRGTCSAYQSFDYGIDPHNNHFYLDLWENNNWIAHVEFEGDGVIILYVVKNGIIKKDHRILYDIHWDRSDNNLSRGMDFAKRVKRECGLDIKYFCNTKD